MRYIKGTGVHGINKNQISTKLEMKYMGWIKIKIYKNEVEYVHGIHKNQHKKRNSVNGIYKNQISTKKELEYMGYIKIKWILSPVT